ncbi:DUF2283 domain-containing protein [Crocosphaera sp.]|uniref:DUF2283 domain-containing protein n=1 Tax=Crocosphaera sp. TaxID=2729996 RepID=UPI00260E3741|nr:DUF2283 domain-containing protein [Crocosphaera sp.]MDJ0582261.1 DUF2283 domain-containing protein [Crocosphaera sp.]
MSFQINYDQEVDAAYLRLENQTVLESEEIADGIIIDYAQDNKIVGVELLGVKSINLGDLSLLIALLPESFRAEIKDFFSLEFNLKK